MKRLSQAIVIVYFLCMCPQILAIVACHEIGKAPVWSEKLSQKYSDFFSSIAKENHEIARTLIIAQEHKLPIVIKNNSPFDGETKGTVSEIGIVANGAVFKINGEIRQGISGLNVRILEVVKTPKDILKKVDKHDRKEVKKLMEAQAQKQSVEIVEDGVLGKTKGQVSNIRLEDGEIVYEIDGVKKEPYYRFKVKLLETISEPNEVLKNTPKDKIEIVKLLLELQESGQVVSISEPGLWGNLEGRISNIRIEDGSFNYYIGDSKRSSTFGIEITPIQSK